LVSSIELTSVTYLRRDVKYDFEVPDYHNYLCAGVIHHNSGKSAIQTIRRIVLGTGMLPHNMKPWYPKERLPVNKDFPLAFRYVGVDHTTFLNTTLPTWQRFAPRELLIDGQWDKSYKEEGKDGQRVLRLGRKNKLYCSIEFMTNEMKVNKFQGPPRQGVDYDEEPRQEIHKENLLRFTTAKKLDFTFAFTPTNGLTWTSDLFDIDTMDPDMVALFKLCAVCNPKAVLSTLKSALEQITDYNELKMRLLGEFISLSGLIYGRLFSPRVHVIPPFVASAQDYVVHCCLDPHLVTPTAVVFLAIDRENNKYVLDSMLETSEVDDTKKEIHRMYSDNGWRWGWTVADKSSNTSIMAFGGLNMYKKFNQQPYALKALRTSEKYEGSIKAGVDEIKKALKVSDFLNAEGRVVRSAPTLFICDTPTNRILVNSFKTLERDTYVNEDKSGQKDRIREGKHHLHAALRYGFQFPLRWYPQVDQAPQPEYMDEAACW
jgi:phage terminase large subunit-like protein